VGGLLLRWVVREADAFCDVALQAFYTGLEEGLFAVVEAGEGVVDFLGSGCLVLLVEVQALEGRDIRLARRERRRTRSQSP